MSCRPDLIIAGVPVPLALSAEGLTQRYDALGGGAILRLADGTGIRQHRWRRLATTVAGSGILPAALAGIDWDAPLLLGCIASRALHTSGAPVALPAARRADAPVFALAVLDGGYLLRPTPVALDEDLASVTPVPGAVAYQVHYYPLLTVLSDGPRETWDALGAAAGWELRCEEV
jgi:hypothetical protein